VNDADRGTLEAAPGGCLPIGPQRRASTLRPCPLSWSVSSLDVTFLSPRTSGGRSIARSTIEYSTTSAATRRPALPVSPSVPSTVARSNSSPPVRRGCTAQISTDGQQRTIGAGTSRNRETTVNGCSQTPHACQPAFADAHVDQSRARRKTSYLLVFLASSLVS